jgi:hypothetical protein
MRLQNIVELLIPAMSLQLIEKDKSTCAALLLILGTDIRGNLLPVLPVHPDRSDESVRVLFAPLGRGIPGHPALP